jgi:hypothetical protein
MSVPWWMCASLCILPILAGFLQIGFVAELVTLLFFMVIMVIFDGSAAFESQAQRGAFSQVFLVPVNLMTGKVRVV